VITVHRLPGVALAIPALVLVFAVTDAVSADETASGSAPLDQSLQTPTSRPARPSRDDAATLSPELRNPAIGRPELEIRLVPLTRDELAELASVWLAKVRAKAMQVMDAQLAVARLGGEARDQARQELTRLTDERRRLVDRARLVLNSWEAKGAPQDELGHARAYLDALVVQTIKISDVRASLSAVGAWLLDEDGGVAVAASLAIALLSGYGLVLAARAARLFVRRHVSKLADLSVLLQTFLAGAAFWAVLAIGLLVVLALLGVGSVPLVALLGAAFFILGLALQNTLGNLAKGLMILVNRPFDEGDYVDIGGASGIVKSVSVFATAIITPDNRKIVIPNQQVWENDIVNRTANATRRVDLIFSIGYKDDLHQAFQVLQAAVKAHPLALDEPAPTIAVTALAESSVDILCGAWARAGDYLTVSRELTADVKLRFDAAGITIPYPQRDVHIHSAGV
jgi:small conductance mechanosensitive channel